MKTRLYVTTLFLILSIQAARAETHFIIDESGAKPRGYRIAVDPASGSERCIAVIRSGLLGSRPVGKGHVVPYQFGNLVIGETGQEGFDFGPVLVWRDEESGKDFIVGRAWDINSIRLEEGFLIKGLKSRGTLLAPGGESAHVDFLAGRAFTEFTGRILDRTTIDSFIEAADGACESGDSSLGSCRNWRTLVELKQSWNNR